MKAKDLVELFGGRLSDGGVGAARIEDYGNSDAEAHALVESCGILDWSTRGRLCVFGEDRIRFLHGQLTTNLKGIKSGASATSVLVSAKGKTQMVLNTFVLEDFVLLDFEPGYSARVIQRLEGYIIADDVQISDAAEFYGQLRLEGPQAGKVVGVILPSAIHLPSSPAIIRFSGWGEENCYLACNRRLVFDGYDLFVPYSVFETVFRKTAEVVSGFGGRLVGENAWDRIRVLAGVPRYGVDIDEHILAPETGLERFAISYSKGCYIGQEVIARIRTYGQVSKALRVFEVFSNEKMMSVSCAKLLQSEGKEVGWLVSEAASLKTDRRFALGYLRKEVNAIGNQLQGLTEEGKSFKVEVVSLPFCESLVG